MTKAQIIIYEKSPVVFRCSFDQNNPKIQLLNLASLTFLDSEVMFIRLQNVGSLG